MIKMIKELPLLDYYKNMELDWSINDTSLVEILDRIKKDEIVKVRLNKSLTEVWSFTDRIWRENYKYSDLKEQGRYNDLEFDEVFVMPVFHELKKVSFKLPISIKESAEGRVYGVAFRNQDAEQDVLRSEILLGFPFENYKKLLVPVVFADMPGNENEVTVEDLCIYVD